MLAGVAEVDITPPTGLEMCGYGPYEKRLGMRVLDLLYARALWLSDGQRDAVILCVDLVGVTDVIHARVAEALATRTGLQRDALLIAASHTHSAPAILPLIAWGVPDEEYVESLCGWMIAAALNAHAARQPARIGFGHARVQGVGVNREHPRHGPTDPAAQLFRIDRADGTTLAVGYNYAAHPVTRWPYTDRISADWPGLVNGALRLAFRGAMPFFLQGCAGNINGHDVLFGRHDPAALHAAADANCGQIERHLVDQILPHLRSIEVSDRVEITGTSRIIDLPLATIDCQRHERCMAENAGRAEAMTYEQLAPLHERILRESEAERRWREARFQVDASRRQLALAQNPSRFMPVRVSVLRVGEAAFVAWPAEVFVELGIELRQRSEIPMTFPVTYANDLVGYIPTAWAFESQGRPNQFGLYPVDRTPLVWGQPPFTAEAPRRLVDHTVAMLRRTRTEAVMASA